MISNLYLAMTAAEIHAAPTLPPRLGWMSCHFSPYSQGLSNLPEALPNGSLLILSDLIPINSHDPRLIACQLDEQAALHGCSGLLLDLQRYPEAQTKALVDYLIYNVSCPVVVSQCFAGEKCTLCLPPCPAHVPLTEYLAPWSGRDIWLELSRSPEIIRLTGSGPAYLPLDTIPEGGSFTDPGLHCHYRISAEPEKAEFQLWRTDDDLMALAEEANGLGIRQFVGLYQELHTILI